jgi:hypothetical protein
LPSFQYKLRKADGKLWIFDIIRKKYVVLMPEEWVRQHFIHYIINELQYPKSLIKVEGGLIFNQLAKRSDIVVFSRAGKPWMLVECKSPEVKLEYPSISQASVYNTTLLAKYIVVTNGLFHFYTRVDWENRTTDRISAMPRYE